MERIHAVAYRASRIGALFGGVLILLAALLLSVDVMIRKVFNVTIGGADELAGYALATGSALAFGFALFERAHVRIDTLYSLFSVRLRMTLDLLGVTAILVFFGVITRHAYAVLEQSVISNTHSLSQLGTPLIVPQAIWVVGLGIFLLIALLLLVRGGLAFLAGDSRALFELIGPRSALEELQQEISSVQKVSQEEEVES